MVHILHFHITRWIDRNFNVSAIPGVTPNSIRFSRQPSPRRMDPYRNQLRCRKRSTPTGNTFCADSILRRGPTHIWFPLPFQEYPYGLRTPRNATRGMQSVLQAFIIKHFIFDVKPRDKSVPLEELLKPTEAEQAQALYLAISDILWNIGEKTKAIFALPGEASHIPHSHVYFQDNVTEKLFFFEFTTLDEMQIFAKRYLPYVSWLRATSESNVLTELSLSTSFSCTPQFTENPGPGALLLLYSAVVTRGMENLRNDLDAPKGAHLMGPYEEGSLNIVTLLLTGRATPYLHNGVVYVGDEDHYVSIGRPLGCEMSRTSRCNNTSI